MKTKNFTTIQDMLRSKLEEEANYEAALKQHDELLQLQQVNEISLLQQKIKQEEDNYLAAMKAGKHFWELKNIHSQIAKHRRTLRMLKEKRKKSYYFIRLSALRRKLNRRMNLVKHVYNYFLISTIKKSVVEETFTDTFKVIKKSKVEMKKEQRLNLGKKDLVETKSG
jgi:hypothetical protein